MALRDLSVDIPPTRKSIWSMLAEAFGYFTGAIKLTDIKSTAQFQENQIKYVSYGHNHNGTAGKNLAASAITEGVFDLNDCQIAWANYFATLLAGESYYAVLGGGGTCLLSTGTTATTTTEIFVYGSTLLDYNPNAATAPGSCTLDIRALAAYDTVDPYSTNWTILHCYACPVNTSGVAAMEKALINASWGTGGGAPYVKFAARRIGTSGISASTGTVSFDYIVVIRKL